VLKNNEIVISDIYLFTFGEVNTTKIPNIPPCLNFFSPMNSEPYFAKQWKFGNKQVGKGKITTIWRLWNWCFRHKNLLRAQTKTYFETTDLLSTLIWTLTYSRGFNRGWQRVRFAAYFPNQLATFSIKFHLSRYCHYLINI